MADQDDFIPSSDPPSQATVWGVGEIEVPIPGPQGEPGPPNSLSIGTVTTGITPAATITGTPPSQVLNLQLPQGPAGPPGNPGQPGSLTVGTVTTGVPAVTITGAAPNQTINFVLPEGTPGPEGPPGSATLIWSGSTNPSNDIGNIGDFYINLSNGDLWGPKGGTGWGSSPAINLKGPKGDPGEVEEAPEDGQMYVRQNGAWVVLPV